ncbi:hypothetical protein ROZALSC1DRAFT_30436, partial [Rozella allomycis CSF55]
ISNISTAVIFLNEKLIFSSLQFKDDLFYNESINAIIFKNNKNSEICKFLKLYKKLFCFSHRLKSFGEINWIEILKFKFLFSIGDEKFEIIFLQTDNGITLIEKENIFSLISIQLNFMIEDFIKANSEIEEEKLIDEIFEFILNTFVPLKICRKYFIKLENQIVSFIPNYKNCFTIRFRSGNVIVFQCLSNNSFIIKDGYKRDKQSGNKNSKPFMDFPNKSLFFIDELKSLLADLSGQLESLYSLSKIKIFFENISDSNFKIIESPNLIANFNVGNINLIIDFTRANNWKIDFKISDLYSLDSISDMDLQSLKALILSKGEFLDEHSFSSIISLFKAPKSALSSLALLSHEISNVNKNVKIFFPLQKHKAQCINYEDSTLSLTKTFSKNTSVLNILPSMDHANL